MVNNMTTINIYRNYGVLSAEKRNVYTYGGQHNTATCSDEIIVEIPDGWEIYESATGNKMVTAPWGWDYEINEVLYGNKIPQFRALNKDGELKYFDLKEIE